MRKHSTAFLALLLTCCISILPAAASDTDSITIGGLENETWFTKYGNVYTDCPADYFVNDLGITWGDLAAVSFLDQELILPVIPTYSYVESNSPAVILEQTDTKQPEGYVSLAINMGNFGETYGLAVKITDEDGNWYWEAADAVTYPVEVSFSLAQKEGYLAKYLLHDLTRTNDRADYDALTDEDFANFREIQSTGMKGKTLYRTSSPIDPEIGRCRYADQALEQAGVTVIMNLAEDAETAASFEGFSDTYYSRQKVIYLDLGIDVLSGDFKQGLARGLRFFAENEGVYAIHCTEGKDRTGFVCALLECLTGAAWEEVLSDYMLTYYNYYGVEPNTEKYDSIARSNIIETMQTVFQTDDLTETDLSACAESYIRSIGLTDAEIAQLKEYLCD